MRQLPAAGWRRRSSVAEIRKIDADASLAQRRSSRCAARSAARAALPFYAAAFVPPATLLASRSPGIIILTKNLAHSYGALAPLKAGKAPPHGSERSRSPHHHRDDIGGGGRPRRLIMRPPAIFLIQRPQPNLFPSSRDGERSPRPPTHPRADPALFHCDVLALCVLADPYTRSDGFGISPSTLSSRPRPSSRGPPMRALLWNTLPQRDSSTSLLAFPSSSRERRPGDCRRNAIIRSPR